jgi:DNA repair protein RadC
MTVLIIHNHPSGDPTPSPEDHELTRRLAAAGVVMGIDLVDHIVLVNLPSSTTSGTGWTPGCARTLSEDSDRSP